jgi:hypothetical protein
VAQRIGTWLEAKSTREKEQRHAHDRDGGRPAPHPLHEVPGSRDDRGERDLVQHEPVFTAGGVRQRGEDAGEPLVLDVAIVGKRVDECRDADRRAPAEQRAPDGDVDEEVGLDDAMKAIDDPEREGHGETSAIADEPPRGQPRIACASARLELRDLAARSPAARATPRRQQRREP